MENHGQRPRPEDFGLSPEATASPPTLVIEPRRGFFCVALLVVAVAATIVGMTWTTGSPTAGLFLGPVFAFASLILLLPLIVGLVYLAASLEERWRSALDPRFRAHRSFHQALESFEAERAARTSPGRQARWRVADADGLRTLASALLGTGGAVETMDRKTSGADLLIRKDGRTMVVRCEAGPDPTDVAVGRELAMARLDLGADEAVLVAPAGGTQVLAEYIAKHPLRLLDAADLQALYRGSE